MSKSLLVFGNMQEPLPVTLPAKYILTTIPKTEHTKEIHTSISSQATSRITLSAPD